jgi:nucleotide-binding universal stress UspA family protein
METIKRILVTTDFSETSQHEEQARSNLNAMAQRLGDDTETRVTSGTPHLEIVRLAQKLKIDLVVMATHGRGFFSHAILGSTTERVIRRVSCPVLVVRDRTLTEERSEE